MVLGEVIFSHIIHHLNPIHHHSPALETHYDNGLWENKGILNFHSINIYCWLILWLLKQQVTAGDQLWPSHSLETRYLERGREIRFLFTDVELFLLPRNISSISHPSEHWIDKKTARQTFQLNHGNTAIIKLENFAVRVDF